MVFWSMSPRYDIYNNLGYRLMTMTGLAGLAEKTERGQKRARSGVEIGTQEHFEDDTVKRGSQTSSKASSDGDSDNGVWNGVQIPMVVVTAPNEVSVPVQRGERGKRRGTLDSGWRKLE